MTKPPCSVCLKGRPNHYRQRVVMRRGRRVQLCELCGKTLWFLPKITTSPQPTVKQNQ